MLRELDETEQMLADTVTKLLDTEKPIADLRATLYGAAVRSRIQEKLTEAGMCGVLVPEDCGGAGLGLRSAGLIAETLGGVLAMDELIFGSYVPSVLLNSLQPSGTIAECLTHIASGRRLVLADDESAGVSFGQPADLVIEDHSGSLSMHGRKYVVPSGDGYLVTGRIGGAPAIVLVEHAHAPATGEYRMSDGSRTQSFEFAGYVPGARVIAAGDGCSQALAATRTAGLLLISSRLEAIARTALSRTIDFMKQRKQFGVALSDFQALRHRVGEMAIQIELASASLQHAIERYEDNVQTAEAAASAAKARWSRVALDTAQEAVHLHGAFGYCVEADIGFYLNSALRWSSVWGDEQLHRRLFGQAVNLDKLAA